MAAAAATTTRAAGGLIAEKKAAKSCSTTTPEALTETSHRSTGAGNVPTDVDDLKSELFAHGETSC